MSVDVPGVDVVETTDWDEPDGGPGRYVHVGQRVSDASDGEPGRNNDTAGALEAIATPGLGGVRTVARVANGLAVGGFVTVLAGFLVSSISTIALGLAGLAGLALAYQVGRRRAGGDRASPESFGTVGGVGVAAAVVGAFGTSEVLPTLDSFTAGGGLFVIGFLLYVAVWEYGRWNLFGDNVPATTATG